MEVLLLIIIISYSNPVYNPERIVKKLTVNSVEEASIEVWKIKKYVMPTYSTFDGVPILKSELFEIDVQSFELKKIEIPDVIFK